MDSENHIWTLISLEHCRGAQFSRYVYFALVPLLIANHKSGQFTTRQLKLKFNRGDNDEWLVEYLQSLDYHDKEYFILEEIKFFFAADSIHASVPPSTVENDRRDLLQKIGTYRILGSHAKCILKAMDFWELRYHVRGQEWFQELREASDEQFARRLQRIQRGKHGSTRDVSDDGYFSEECKDEEKKEEAKRSE